MLISLSVNRQTLLSIPSSDLYSCVAHINFAHYTFPVDEALSRFLDIVSCLSNSF